ncbi:hypothetical protein [uncultured Umboniibacter sp.]|uniref:hypothetical protein n=1 Tax=uncultured Umboniibacter sp. TaxID=1798917 RepID=UPI002624DBE4|nr:hypothetical protein [uncultured Umboniibacter sp.]
MNILKWLPLTIGLIACHSGEVSTPQRVINLHHEAVERGVTTVSEFESFINDPQLFSDRDSAKYIFNRNGWPARSHDELFEEWVSSANLAITSMSVTLNEPPIVYVSPHGYAAGVMTKLNDRLVVVLNPLRAERNWQPEFVTLHELYHLYSYQNDPDRLDDLDRRAPTFKGVILDEGTATINALSDLNLELLDVFSQPELGFNEAWEQFNNLPLSYDNERAIGQWFDNVNEGYVNAALIVSRVAACSQLSVRELSVLSHQRWIELVERDVIMKCVSR